jgi:hypothetical protein
MSLFERPGSKLTKKERDLLEDLLQQMIRYEASMRIPADKAKTHPWFTFETKYTRKRWLAQLLKNADTS